MAGPRENLLQLTSGETVPNDFNVRPLEVPRTIEQIEQNLDEFTYYIFQLFNPSLVPFNSSGEAQNFLGRVQRVLENASRMLTLAKEQQRQFEGKTIGIRKIEQGIRFRVYLAGTKMDEGYQDPVLFLSEYLERSLLGLLSSMGIEHGYCKDIVQSQDQALFEPQTAIPNPNSYFVSLIGKSIERLIYGSLADRLWVPNLDPSRSQDISYNTSSVVNTLAQVDQHLEKPDTMARYFEMVDESGKKRKLFLTASVVEKLKLMHRIAREQPDLRRKDWSVVEIMVFFTGKIKQRDQTVIVDGLHIPRFKYQGDTIDVSIRLPQLEGEEKLIGTHHIHPGGPEWAILSDMDLMSDSPIADIYRYSSTDYYRPNAELLFNSVQPRNAGHAIFPFHPNRYQELMGNMELQRFGISPYEPLRREKATYLDL